MSVRGLAPEKLRPPPGRSNLGFAPEKFRSPPGRAVRGAPNAGRPPSRPPGRSGPRVPKLGLLKFGLPGRENSRPAPRENSDRLSPPDSRGLLSLRGPRSARGWSAFRFQIGRAPCPASLPVRNRGVPLRAGGRPGRSDWAERSGRAACRGGIDGVFGRLGLILPSAVRRSLFTSSGVSSRKFPGSTSNTSGP